MKIWIFSLFRNSFSFSVNIFVGNSLHRTLPTECRWLAFFVIFEHSVLPSNEFVFHPPLHVDGAIPDFESQWPVVGKCLGSIARKVVTGEDKVMRSSCQKNYGACSFDCLLHSLFFNSNLHFYISLPFLKVVTHTYFSI